jgi:hypothetical protein
MFNSLVRGEALLEIELFRMIAQVLAMNALPDEPAIGVDIHFGDAELGGRQIFPGGVDALDL